MPRRCRHRPDRPRRPAFKTFLSGGAFGSAIATKKEGEKAKVSSGRDLARRIGHGNERIIFTIIAKFHTASKLPECNNPSENMIVLVDEGHRSHGGEGHERMRKALPNAAYVAFTGTPLLKKEKRRTSSGLLFTPTPCSAPSRMEPLPPSL